jgi:uncharacterized membrane protein YkvA (DUF1232 family)
MIGGVPVLQILLGMIAALAATWALFLLVLVLFRPKGLSRSEAKRLVPDIVRLVRELAKDRDLPRGVRRRLTFLLAYLACPIDLVPDFIPVLGYADDVIVVAIVLRSVVRRAGTTAVDQHWRGSPEGLAVVRRLCGVA